MAIDPYAPCPCGSGKKVKFCCADLVGEIEQVQRMMKGDQTVACLQFIERLETKHPDHPFFMRAKAALQSRLGQEEQASQTLDNILSQNAEDASALADKAILATKNNDVAAAVASLQQSLDACDGHLTGAVARAIAFLGEALMANGQVLAARGHLMLAVSVNAKDEHALGLLIQLNRAEQIPLMLKQDFSMVNCPEDAPWKADFDSAIWLFRNGRWAGAAEKFNELSGRVDDSPALWRNLATLRGWLTDTAGAVAAWRSLAALDVPLEEAVEAEALAQLLDPDVKVQFIDVLNIEFAARDFDAIQPRLAADNRCLPAAVPPTPPEDDEPPPRAAFLLLDPPMPDSGAELEIDAVPNIIGELFLYGRQTDREARVELHVLSGHDVARAKTLVTELAGDLLEERPKESVAGETPAASQALNWRWRLPRDTPPEHVHKLVSAKRRQMLLDRWPDAPLDAGDGMTPREAAAKPETRIAALAAVLLLEQQMAQTGAAFDFNELRTALDLPTLDPIEPAEIVGRQVPAHRLSRITAEKLTDEDLLRLFEHSQMLSASAAMRKLGREIAARGHLDDKVEKADVYALLASLEEDTGQALELLNQAVALALNAGKSPARILLQQLELQLERGNGAQVGQLVQRLSTTHAKEPGIGQALFNILYQAGLIGPDGRPVSAPAAAPPGLVTPGGEAAEPSQLWTPDSQEPAGKKAALWTPGMD